MDGVVGVSAMMDTSRPERLTTDGPRVLDMADVISNLRRGWLRILATTLLALALAFAYSVYGPGPRYQSSTRLLIDPRGLQVVEKELTPRTQTSDLSIAVVESQMRVLASDSVLTRVIDREQLISDPEFGSNRVGSTAGLRTWLGERLHVRLGSAPVPQDPVVRTLEVVQKAVRTERLPNSFVVDLFVTAEDPQRSAKLANTIASTYIETEFETRSDQARRSADALSTRLGELRERVRLSEQAVERFKAENNIVVASGGLVYEQEITQLAAQLMTARGQTAQTQARIDQIAQLTKASARADTISEVVQSTTIGLLRGQLATAQQRVASLGSTLKSGHPELSAARARVDDISSQINAEVARIVRSTRNDHERARISERKLNGELESMKTATAATNRARVQLRELERESEAGRVIYEAFLVRAREIGEQRGLDTSIARVISPAVPPRSPGGLSPTVLFAIALGLGLGLGSCLAVFGQRKQLA